MDLMIWIRNQWDRVGAWVLVALGGLSLILGWIGVSGTPYSFEQIPYVISGGLGGIFLLGVGAMLWISADLRDEWRKLDELLELERSRGGGGDSAPMSAGESSGNESRSGSVQQPDDTDSRSSAAPNGHRRTRPLRPGTR
jgi:hypothetical protein